MQKKVVGVAADPIAQSGPERLRGFQIDFRLRQFAEKGIRLLLLLKRLIEERRSFVHALSCMAHVFRVP